MSLILNFGVMDLTVMCGIRLMKESLLAVRLEERTMGCISRLYITNRHVRWVKSEGGSFAHNVDQIHHKCQLYDVIDTLGLQLL